MTPRSIAAAAAFAAIAFASPAFAQTPTAMTCSDADITRVTAETMKLPEGVKRTAAMKELDMAKQMMAAKDQKACTTHLDTAMGHSR
jgi:hypothetical protein